MRLIILLTFSYSINFSFAQDLVPETFSIRKMQDDNVMLDKSTATFGMLKGIASKTVDLNNDNTNDYIVYFGNCGNYGDCIYGFFIGKGGNRYECVFEEYLPPFKIATTSKLVNNVRWKEIIYTERGTDRNDFPITIEKKLSFNGSVYEF